MSNAADFASLFFDFIANLQQQKVVGVVMMLWCIWKRRNEKVWEDVERCVRISIQLARDYIVQWRNVEGRRPHTTSTMIDGFHLEKEW